MDCFSIEIVEDDVFDYINNEGEVENGFFVCQGSKYKEVSNFLELKISLDFVFDFERDWKLRYYNKKKKISCKKKRRGVCKRLINIR